MIFSLSSFLYFKLIKLDTVEILKDSFTIRFDEVDIKILNSLKYRAHLNCAMLTILKVLKCFKCQQVFVHASTTTHFDIPFDKSQTLKFFFQNLYII